MKRFIATLWAVMLLTLAAMGNMTEAAGGKSVSPDDPSGFVELAEAVPETCTERNALSERERDSRHVGETLAEEVVGAATEVVGIRTRNRDTLLREREARGVGDLDRVEEARDRDKDRLEEVVAVGAAAYEIEPKINLAWSLKGHRHG